MSMKSWEKLENKPLVEAIFELRWELQKSDTGLRGDPHYKVLVGAMFERVKKQYPYHEPLPIASMPDEIAEYVVRHRFRTGKGEWPLIQVGPGIITLNDTKGYKWENFKQGMSSLLDTFFKAYPSTDISPTVNGLIMRYIDAIEYDYTENDIFSFLREKLKTDISFEKSMLKTTNVPQAPEELDLRFAFPSSEPPGLLKLRFYRGKVNEKDLLLWDTIVHSANANCPQNRGEIFAWAENAHQLINKLFFSMIKGELYERFK